MLTVTVTGFDVTLVPFELIATAVNTWLPFEVVPVPQANVYGAAVMAAPRFAPSSLNCTEVIGMSLVGEAATVTVPKTVAPVLGLVIDTEKGGGGAGVTVTETVVE